MDINARQQAEAGRALDWLNTHWKGVRSCPICGTNNWELGITSEMRAFNGGNLLLGGPGGSVMPFVPVTCANCGLTHMFSAIKAGVIRMDEYRDDEASA